MAVLERDVVLMGRDGGRDTIDLPVTCLKNIEDTAEVKETPAAEDFLPIVDSSDGGQMKKTPLSAILEPLEAAGELAREAKDAADTAVPAGRKVNGKALSADIALEAADVGAAAADHSHTAEQVGAATIEQVDAAIQAAVLDSWEGSY